ncbi:MAG TPA: DUF362 domain-containing protein [Spirochaetota bacterium]|nr:DUF362 domain-containing protein [Spirochaetota bacterium]HOD14172.1 DUF362 domain-containing protein [Spirochaetota bacterium]HPN12838.1 DUF362 domain-containing protein [Spirochaetota bacterium]HQL80663.1 DUF362 domain-containing protein [Spirochaetota bacterium]
MLKLIDAISRFTVKQKAATSRKNFLKGIAAAIGSVPIVKTLAGPVLAGSEGTLAPRVKKGVRTACDLAVVKGGSPAAITRKAIEALGGIDRFVKKGDTVVIKPNIGWDRAPEYAANTNPEVVETLIRLCKAAGARRVRVFDNSCNAADMCYRNSGIAAAVKKAEGYISYINKEKFLPGRFPAGSEMEDWPIYRDAVECDCFINVPIAKNHGLTKLTLSMKNLMGVCGGMRGRIHWNIDKKLPELAKFISPDLTVIDAYRILLRYGPSGGDLKDVKKTGTVIAGTDPVLADSYAASLFGLSSRDIDHIMQGERYGLGTTNIGLAKITKITI